MTAARAKVVDNAAWKGARPACLHQGRKSGSSSGKQMLTAALSIASNSA